MRIKLLAALLAVGLVVAACGGNGKGDGGQEADQANGDITVAFSTIVLSDRFFVRLQEGMQQAADEAGIELILHNPDGDPTAQFSAVEDFIAQGVDVIIVDPLDPNGIVPALEQARDAGIPVVAVDEVLEGSDLVTVGVGDDNRGVGEQLGRELLDYMDREGIGSAEVGVVQTLDAPIENTRFEGFESVVTEGGKVEIVGRVDAKFAVDRAANGAEDLITANPGLDFFYGTGGNYMIGSYSAIQSQGVEDKVKMIGWDLSSQLMEAIERNIYIMAAEQDAMGMGTAAIEVAIQLANGEDVPREVAVPVTYVNEENVDQFRSEYEE